MESSLSEYFTVGNVFLALVFLLVLNQLIELYQFRNMPPGPRLTSLPFIGNLFSFDSGETLREFTRRFVYTELFPFFCLESRDLNSMLIVFSVYRAYFSKKHNARIPS